jgi:hypothetical protein
VDICYNTAVFSEESIVSESLNPLTIEVIDDQLAEVLRTKTPEQRVEMIAAANRTARVLAAAGVRHQHPDWDEARVQAEVIRRVTGGTN